MDHYVTRRFLALGVRLLAGCCLLFAAVEAASWIGRARDISPPAVASGEGGATGPYGWRVLLAVVSPGSTVTAGDGQSRGVWEVTLSSLWSSLPWMAASCLAVLGFGIPLGIAVGRRRWLTLSVWPLWLLGWLPVAWLAMAVLWGAVDRWRIPMMDFEAVDSQRELEQWRGFLATVLAILPGLGWQALRVSRAVASETLEGWVEWGKLRGQPRARVFHLHVIRHAVAPMLHTLPETLPAIVSAFAVAEWVLGFPGYGWLVIEAARQRQVVVLCAAVLAGLLIMAVVRLLAELAHGWADSRLRSRRAYRPDSFD